MKVGWIGLGQMGLPTAATIAAAGHAVRGFDVNAPAPGTHGAVELVGSVAQAAQECDLLCIAVFSDSQVSEVLTGPDGVMGQLKPGAVVAVFTTGAIEFIQALAASAPAGVTVLDTCFSRKQSEVASGRLTLLIGGDGDGIERARPALETFARTIFHVGGSGAGRAIKLVNNVLFAAHAQVAADAMKLAQGLGLERASTAAALLECSGASDILANFIAVEPDVMLDQIHRYMVKDVAAALDAGANANVVLGPLPAATATYLN